LTLINANVSFHGPCGPIDFADVKVQNDAAWNGDPVFYIVNANGADIVRGVEIRGVKWTEVNDFGNLIFIGSGSTGTTISGLTQETPKFAATGKLWQNGVARSDVATPDFSLQDSSVKLNAAGMAAYFAGKGLTGAQLDAMSSRNVYT
jgi:hypothetical protein